MTLDSGGVQWLSSRQPVGQHGHGVRVPSTRNSKWDQVEFKAVISNRHLESGTLVNLCYTLVANVDLWYCIGIFVLLYVPNFMGWLFSETAKS